MDVRFLSPEWKHLDALKCEAILAPFFSDERPLCGALGLIDWRLSGFVSKMIVRGFVGGELGETVLVPLRPGFSIDKLFLFGLGPQAEFGPDSLLPATVRMFDVVSRAKVRTTAIVLPGRSTERSAPVAAMESFVAAGALHSNQDEVILLEPASAQKEMAPIVQRERRRARASGE
ncbi:MAG TPA: M17 family peptidase N-terminal domain-containing protein [Polyangiales bacterium]